MNNKQMIYLIGGAPRCGKTILAQKLAKDLSVSWISTDDLEQEAKQNIPKAEQAGLYPKDKIREKTESSNDRMYTNYSADEILGAYLIQSKATWKAISSLVESKIHDNEGIIIEGFQVEPELIHKLTEQFGAENIKAVVLTKNNIDQIVETARQSKDPDDWFIKKTTDPAIHYKIGEMLAKYSNYFQKEADEYNIKIIEYRGDFEAQMNEAAEYNELKGLS